MHYTSTGFNRHSRSTMQTLVLDVNLAKRLGKARREQQREEARAYLDGTHTFQLLRGDTPFGAPKEMTGREAKALNTKFERKFFNDKSPNARLWCWKRVTQ